MKMLYATTLVLLVSIFAGCRTHPSTISDDARYELQKPVDCATAETDIGILESEKASTSQQIKAGVKMVVPASAAMGILRREYIDRGVVATGEYNKEIEAKIKEIKSACGME